MTQNPPRRRLVLCATVGLLALASARADAGDVIMFQEEPPLAAEIADIMFPKEGAPPAKIATRGIRFADTPGAAPSPEAKELQNTTADQGDAVGFRINFAFDSADLHPDALPYLDRVGQMMGLEQAQDRAIVIVGHTDASGTDAYNKDLSERRALTVGTYLHQRHGIPAERIQIVGLGEAQPLAGLDALDGANRRVEFHPAK